MPLHAQPHYHEPRTDERRYIVVGSGPVGMRFVQELLKRQPMARVIVFGNEPYQPYNRVQLSSLLAGDVSREAMNLTMPDPSLHPHFEFIIAAIRQIQTDRQAVTDAKGNQYNYDKLIIATGSRAHVPDIPGINQQGVYTFRNIKDTETLYARVTRSRHVVVVGGGLLGLEAARGMLKFNTRVTIIQQAPRLMNRQLDPAASAMLCQRVEALDINVILNSGVREIFGDGRVSGVRTRNGDILECDTVLLCAGITANIELAKTAKLKLGRGIIVSDTLQTSDESIFAIGECCEYNGQTYGLVSPGFEQAAVLADHLSDGSARYAGSLSVSRLKVLGYDVCSMGTVSELPKRPQQYELSYRDSGSGNYRKLVVYKREIIGVAGIGEWPEINRIQEAFQTKRRLYAYQLMQFRVNGKLWLKAASDNIKAWPNSALICQCNSVSKGRIVDAIENGATSIDAIQASTSAGIVCGSCKPLLAQLANSDAPSPKETAWPLLLGCSSFAVIFALLIIFVPEARVATSVQTESWFQGVWNDKFWKQVTGFSLLGLSLLGLLMSLRKRLKISWLGNFGFLRAFHATLGTACAALLIAHTGFHLGSNLNRWLILNFLGILLLGASAGGVVALGHYFKPSTERTLRSVWTWLHIIVTWPLPALIGVHILSVYYF